MGWTEIYGPAVLDEPLTPTASDVRDVLRTTSASGILIVMCAARLRPKSGQSIHLVYAFVLILSVGSLDRV